MRETVVGTKETNRAASQLMSMGQSLELLVKRFRIADDHHYEIFDQPKGENAAG
jgi:hypothetical protein